MTNHQWVPLTIEKHQQLKLIGPLDKTFFKQQQLAPVSFSEMPRLCGQFPLVLVKNTETGQFVPVAMMGLEPGQNLFNPESQHMPEHLPMSLLKGPFSLQRATADSGEVMVCVDESSDLLDTEQGQPLFDANGEQSQLLQTCITRLMTLAQDNERNQQAIQMLSEYELLIQQSLNYQIDGQERSLDGIYLVDEQKLNQLPAESLATLRDAGVLAGIYAHLASLHSIQKLVRLQAGR